MKQGVAASLNLKKKDMLHLVALRLLRVLAHPILQRQPRRIINNLNSKLNNQNCYLNVTTCPQGSEGGQKEARTKRSAITERPDAITPHDF
jgi:hypothetical protein